MAHLEKEQSSSNGGTDPASTGPPDAEECGCTSPHGDESGEFCSSNKTGKAAASGRQELSPQAKSKGKDSGDLNGRSNYLNNAAKGQSQSDPRECTCLSERAQDLSCVETPNSKATPASGSVLKHPKTPTSSLDSLPATPTVPPAKQVIVGEFEPAAPPSVQQDSSGHGTQSLLAFIDHEARGAQRGDPQGDVYSRSLLLPIQNLLPHLPELEGEEGSESSSGSGRLGAPWPPVPSDMAEAIKRQRKGAGNVRYWKTKHLQSGGGQANGSVKHEGGTVLQKNGMFPVLKPPAIVTNTDLSSGSVVGAGGHHPLALGTKPSKARERLIRQRGKENHFALLAGYKGKGKSGVGVANSPMFPYHTQYMFGQSLGSLPTPSPAYKRSVTEMEAAVLSLPLHAAAASSNTSNNANTASNSTDTPGPNPPHPNPYATASCSFDSPNDPKLHAPMAKTSLSPSGRAVLPVPHDWRLRPLPLDTVRSSPRGDGQGSGFAIDGNPGDRNSMVPELTCLQLADMILGTKTTDLSRFYQLCQTKIRYVDILERATLRTNEAASQTGNDDSGDGRDVSKLLNKPLKPSLSLTTAQRPLPIDSLQRRSTWVPTGDRESGVLDGKGSGDFFDALEERKRASGGKGIEHDGNGPAASPSSITLLPALVSSHHQGLPVSRNSEADSAMTLSPRNGSSPPPPPSQSTFAGKPILKPYNQDASLVKVNHHHHHHHHHYYHHHHHLHPHDPFSPRSVPSKSLEVDPLQGGRLSVRGTTMYPFSTEENRWGIPRGQHSKRSLVATPREASDLRKRAVRFSISDQVYEFAPGEPVKP